MVNTTKSPDKVLESAIRSEKLRGQTWYKREQHNSSAGTRYRPRKDISSQAEFPASRYSGGNRMLSDPGKADEGE